jgi:hypothetical protein
MHGHVHVFELPDNSKLACYNLQFLNKDEMGIIKNALDKVTPKDRNEVYDNMVKTINNIIVEGLKFTSPKIS